MDRVKVRDRIINAFDREADDPIASVLGEIVDINEELKLSIMAEYAEPQPEILPIEEREWKSSAIFYHPEECGLELLAVAEEDEAYQFDYVCLWMDKDSGRYFVAQDSGCSCPSPFEDHTSVSHLTEVRTQDEAMQFLTAYKLKTYTADSIAAYVRAVKEHLDPWA